MTLKVTIVGSGNWGSCIAKIVALNVQKFAEFDRIVPLWVNEELVGGKNLSEIINTTRQNVKYLPGIILPDNIIAEPNLLRACKEADILVFVTPHQFLPKILTQLFNKIKSKSYGVTLNKGFDTDRKGNIVLISDLIRETLKIPCASLSGANIASEVAKEEFSEATLGCRDPALGDLLKKLFNTDFFRITLVPDEIGVELCGALKNIVAIGCGFVEGLGYGDNTRAATIRIGLMEIIKFMHRFYDDREIDNSTVFESCGIADLITTCWGGRNRKVAIEFAKGGKTINQIEKELLNGQSAQGPITAKEVNGMLQNNNLEKEFPFFTTVHEICEGRLAPLRFLNCLKEHPY